MICLTVQNPFRSFFFQDCRHATTGRSSTKPGLKLLAQNCLLGLLLLVLTGCSNFIKLHHDLKTAQETVSVANGTLSAPDCPQCALILVVLGQNAQALSYKVFEHPGPFTVHVSTTAKSLLAFQDANGNLAFDPDEPYAWKTLPIPAKENLFLDIKERQGDISATSFPRGNLIDLRDRWIAGIDLQLGRITNLADSRFESSNSELGMWQPLQFVQTGLAGIYFLEPYNPHKTPVLFIHGINGSPRDFAPLLEYIDEKKYQPWFFYYPTGIGIEAVGIGLIGMLNKLWHEQHFANLHIVAHSMGGVVARSFLSSCQKENECDYVRTFVSISSPFGGDAYAQGGIDFAPVVMPVWRNIAQGSDFLRNLFSTPMPEGVQHFMLFGYRNTNKLLHQDGDGTIPLDSQLRLEAQQQASEIRGFNEDHVGILASRPAGEYINSVLATLRNK